MAVTSQLWANFDQTAGGSSSEMEDLEDNHQFHHHGCKHCHQNRQQLCHHHNHCHQDHCGF